MNAIKGGITRGNFQAYFIPRAAFFHSTPFLERGRRNQWEARYDHHHRRSRKQQYKRFILRDVSSYAEELFKSWQSEFDSEHGFPNRGPSWFRGQNETNRSRGNNSHNQRHRSKGRRGFEFSEDYPEVETIFRNAFAGRRYFFWSFVNDDHSRWGHSSGYSNGHRSSWNWRYHSEEEYEYDSSPEQDSLQSSFASNRLALGLSATGPLKIDDVKTAYRACALKWHPDRHLGESKTVAEEKFKLCTAAYQSLCDRLT